MILETVLTQILLYTIFTFVVWKMFKAIFLYGRTVGAELAFITDQAWKNLSEMMTHPPVKEVPCNYTTDKHGNICFSMSDILPLIIRKLTDQGDLILNKNGAQYIMVGAEQKDDGEIILQLNVKDCNVKSISATKH